MKRQTKKASAANKSERRAQQAFHALAAAPRRAILRYLAASGLTAGEISSRFDMAKPSVSQHLAILENAGLITREKRGQFVHYALAPNILKEVLTGFLQDLEPSAVPATDEPAKPQEQTGQKSKAKSAKAAQPVEAEASDEPAAKPLPSQMSMF
ncbi:metalloregulator ArsR/SmtB family transcription factor [Ciceribacter sichuanensis]|uniref:metalloregulator ArsR/SmtB family transcription factor n=1 Tax=Ciceribacter sichuanensis TaxID=2949647 RepID=UPI003CC9127B